MTQLSRGPPENLSHATTWACAWFAENWDSRVLPVILRDSPLKYIAKPPPWTPWKCNCQGLPPLHKTPSSKGLNHRTFQKPKVLGSSPQACLIGPHLAWRAAALELQEGALDAALPWRSWGAGGVGSGKPFAFGEDEHFAT